MPWNGVATPVSLTPITVAFWVTNAKENLEDHETRILAVEASTTSLSSSKVNRAGDTMSGFLDFSGDGVGIRLGQNGTLVDYDTAGTTLFAGDNVLRVLDQAGSVVIFRAASADDAPTFKGQTMYHAGNLPSVAGVPSGLIAMVTNAAAIPTGWSRETLLDGRIPVGDGMTFTVTFTAENNYGSGWSHNHDMQSHVHSGPSHSHGASALGIAGTSSQSSGSNGVSSGGGEAASTTHTHGAGSYDVSGTTDAAGTGNTGTPSTNATGNTEYIPPSRAVVFVKKD